MQLGTIPATLNQLNSRNDTYYDIVFFILKFEYWFISVYILLSLLTIQVDIWSINNKSTLVQNKSVSKHGATVNYIHNSLCPSPS
jgi:hypothetical protein